MADEAHAPRASESNAAAGSGDSFAVPLFAVVLVAAALAGAAGHLLSGAAGWVAAAVVAVFGGVVAGVATRGGTGGGESRARLLTNALRSEHAMNPKVPAGWTDGWAELYERASELSHETKMSQQARMELERARRQTELAVKVLRDGKDPLIEIAELRVGPLRELLEVARERAGSIPVVNRIPLGEAELVKADGEPLPDPWPKGAAEQPSAVDVKRVEEMRRGLDELIAGLTRIDESLAVSGGGSPGAARTPAQLVDAVVHTAADGIEDLAAGLMRANELAAVAERVTNKATLLALNAALEATRSGSEAFAAIAEETRRLAEFAREATDTIAQLSSEIEYKVGETITAIHATSEDAKTAVAALPSAIGSDAPPRPAISPKAVAALLRRARSIRDMLDGPAPSRGPGAPPAPASDEAPSTPELPSTPEPRGRREDDAAESPRSGREEDDAAAPAPEKGVKASHIPLLDGLMPGSGLEQ